LKRDISASLGPIWAEFILAERGDCGLSSYHGCPLRVSLPATMPIDSFCKYRRRCQKKKIYIAQHEKKGLLFFFGLYAPENLATPQSTLQIVRENGRRGGWLPSSIHRATPGLQGGGRSGWTVQASAVGRSCRDRWRSLLCSQRYVVSKETYYSVKRDLLQCQKRPTDSWRSLLCPQRYVAPPRHAGSKDRVSVKRLAPKP